MKQEIEPEDSRIRHLANMELQFKTKKTEKERMIGVCHESIEDLKGLIVQKVHRTRMRVDQQSGLNVEFDIADYVNADEIRQITE